MLKARCFILIERITVKLTSSLGTHVGIISDIRGGKLPMVKWRRMMMIMMDKYVDFYFAAGVCIKEKGLFNSFLSGEKGKVFFGNDVQYSSLLEEESQTGDIGS